MTTETATHGAAISAGHLDLGKPHALEHITVMGFTRVLAGPTCTRMLADAGDLSTKLGRRYSYALTSGSWRHRWIAGKLPPGWQSNRADALKAG